MSGIGPLERSQDQEVQNQRFYDQMNNQNIQRAGSIGQLFVDNYVKGQQLEMQGDEQVAQMAMRRSRLATEALRRKQLRQQMLMYQSELELRQQIANTKMIEAEARQRLEATKEKNKSDYYKERNKIDAYRGQVGSMWEEDGKVWTLVPSPGESGRYYKRIEVTDKDRINAWRSGALSSSSRSSSGSSNPSLLDRRDSATLRALVDLRDQSDKPEDIQRYDELIKAVRSRMQRGSTKEEPKATGYNKWFNALDNDQREKIIEIRRRYPNLTDQQIMDGLRKRGIIK